MRCWSIVSALLAVIGVLLVVAPFPIQAQRNGSRVERVNGRDVAAGEVLVKLRRPLRREELGRLGQDHDLDSLETVGRAGLRRVRSRSRDVATLLRALSADPDVEFAEPNYVVHAFAEPDDPSFPQLWGLRNLGQPVNGTPGTPGADIHASDAWNLAVGSTATVVAVVDT